MIHSRIAPTPSGYLHTGNAFNFVITWLLTRKQDGTLRLRIDDIDSPRAKPDYLDDIFITLDWLGLDWDEGPYSPDQHNNVFSQVLRGERYDQLISALIQTRQVFSCSCSRKSLAAQECHCREKKLNIDEPDTALKLYTPVESWISVSQPGEEPVELNLYQQMRDFIIRRRDGIASYQIASLADDTDLGINLIVRGKDLLLSTAAQLYLAQLLGLSAFSKTVFYHHPLLTDEHGEKLSKSAGSTSLKAWRESGKTPEEFYLMLSNILKLQQPLGSLNELLDAVKREVPLLFPGKIEI